MNNMDSNDNPCRICLTSHVFFDWTEAIFEFSGPSYKQCYYQYTHLSENDEDLHTPMLCLECGNGLRNAYILVEKALASNLKLKEIKCKVKADNSSQFDKDQVIALDMYNYEKSQFIADNPFKFEKEEIYIDMRNSENAFASDQNLNNEKSGKNVLQFEKEQVLLTDMHNSFNVSTEDSLEINTDNNEHDLTEDIAIVVESDEDTNSVTEFDFNKDVKIKKRKEQNLLCSYCSRTFKELKHLMNHEKTHEPNRERTEVCTICGLKFYDKYSLSAHMAIHDDNRERKYKCEFCTKAFFARGALNVHRRIHLGQMIKCSFCPKEYSRQVDMDRHMKSHNVMPITANSEMMTTRKQTKYFRECDICGQKVNNDYWKHHKAKHLNKHTLQCAVCSKKFFPRSKVKRHLKQIHNIASDEYDKFLIKLDDKFEPRLSRLMIEQEITKVFTEK